MSKPFKSIVKSVGGTIKKTISSAKDLGKGVANATYGVATLDSDKIKRGLSQQKSGLKSNFEVMTQFDLLKAAGGELKRGIADISGAKAAQDQLNMQNQLAQQEARRQALLSDAMARESGGEGADVRLGSRSRRRRGAGSISTGISGTGSSRQTGVQG
jgi:hypothetical protein